MPRELSLLDFSGSSLRKPHSQSLSSGDPTQSSLSVKIPNLRAFVKSNQQQLFNTTAVSAGEISSEIRKLLKKLKENSREKKKCQEIVLKKLWHIPGDLEGPVCAKKDKRRPWALIHAGVLKACHSKLQSPLGKSRRLCSRHLRKFWSSH